MQVSSHLTQGIRRAPWMLDSSKWLPDYSQTGNFAELGVLAQNATRLPTGRIGLHCDYDRKNAVRELTDREFVCPPFAVLPSQVCYK